MKIKLSKILFFLIFLTFTYAPFLSLANGGNNAANRLEWNVPDISGAGGDLLSFINTIANYLLWIAVVAAPLACVVAALIFLTAGGNDRRITTAKKMLTWAVIGITVALVSKGIVYLVANFMGSKTNP